MFSVRRLVLALSALVLLLPASANAAVTNRAITITDPQVGKLTFDALTAGNPADAQRGRLVILLHGFPQNAEAWRPMLEPLAAAGYYAVAPNQRGYSPRARPASVGAYATSNMVRDTLAMADALGAPRFHLVSHDWGGIVGWRTAAAAPSRVLSNTVLSTSHPRAIADATLDLSTGQWVRFLYTGLFASEGFDQFLLAFDGFFMVETLKGQGLPEANARRYYQYLKDPAAMRAALNWYKANPIPQDWVFSFGPTTVPTTFVWGQDEFAFGPESAQLTARYVAAPYTFKVVPAVGHWVPENATQIVTDLILKQVKATS